HIIGECPRPKRLQDSDYFKDKMLLMQAQENSAGEQVTNFDDDVDDPTKKDLALNVDHIFEVDQCDAFDSDVDEAPNIQTMFMNKVAIGYKNPLYLTRAKAKQVQSALYNGHELVKTSHVPTVVRDSEDTLETAEITRKEMLAK
ncbi:hypothetical protein Tco_0187609, partial [Tanacetum coccineum]